MPLFCKLTLKTFKNTCGTIERTKLVCVSIANRKN